jgi:protein TonB
MQWMTMRTAGVDTSSGYTGGGRSPIGIGGAIAVHGAAIAIFLLMPREMITEITKWEPFVATNIPADPPPPETKEKPADPLLKTQPAPEKPTVVKDPFVPLPPFDGAPSGSDRNGPGEGNGSGTVIAPPPPLPDPVLTDAAIDPGARAGFQPDYPGAMIRQGMEGSVTVRVTIGADGRVIDIARISATDEAFWLATQRHALRKWRFRPATRDGAPVSSVKTLTVHFRLEDR